MRLLFLVMILLLGSSPAAADFDIPKSTRDMLHLSVTATNVRLRAGAGTEFEILGMASSGDFSASRYLADAQPRMDSSGKPWFRLIANVQQQTELAIFKLDKPCWIRSDFVKTRALRERETQVAESSLFRVLHISLDGMPGLVRFSPEKELPVCAEENDCFFAEGKAVTNKMLPAGESYILWTMPTKSSTGNVCISIWKQIGENRIQLAGTMPLHTFRDFDFGPENQKKIKHWMEQQPALYWQ